MHTISWPQSWEQHAATLVPLSPLSPQLPGTDKEHRAHERQKTAHRNPTVKHSLTPHERLSRPLCPLLSSLLTSCLPHSPLCHQDMAQSPNTPAAHCVLVTLLLLSATPMPVLDICSQKSFCQKHLVLPVEKSCSSCKAQIWHHLLWETPQDPPMHRPPFHTLLPWYLGEGPKSTSQPLCPCPSTCFDQISLGLSLISELSEPVPSGPSDSPEAQILGG